MNIRAIALDMDGTLLDAHGSISGHVIELLAAIRKKGMRIFIATGRTRTEINDVLPDHLRVDGFVAANGMECYTELKQIAHYTLDKHMVGDVIAAARKKKLFYEVHPLRGSRCALAADRNRMTEMVNKEQPVTLLDNEYLSRKNAVKHKITWAEELSTDNIVKIYFFSMDTGEISDWKHTLNEMKKQTNFSTSSSSLHNVEIMAGDVSKATGINMLLQEYNLSANELMVIGDGDNDLPMFNLAAYSVAMINAEDFVKEKADEVTIHSYKEDGLYHYLNDRFG